MKTKKLILLTLGLLLCATQGFAATQYCNESVSATGGDVKFSLTNVSGNTYRITLYAQGTLSFTAAYNMNLGVNQTDGAGIGLGNGTWTVASKEAYSQFTTSSSSSLPTSFYGNYMCLQKTGGTTAGDLVEISGFNPSNIDWTATCSGGGDTEAPVMTSASVTSTTHNSAVVAVAAADNVGVTAYVVKNGDAEVGTYTPSDGKITITGLTASTTYNYTVYAKDAAGNVSASGKDITITTTAAPAVVCDGDRGHFAGVPPTYPYRIHYEIEYDNGNVKYTVNAVDGGTLDFLEVQTTKGNYSASINAGVGTYTQTGLTLGETIGIRFLYSTTIIGAGREMTSENINLSDANIIKYKVGDCAGLLTSNLTRTSEASVTLTKVGETSTITHTTSSTGAITYESSNTDVATVYNGVITAVADGNATITISQAANATYEAGSFTVNVTVSIPVPVTGVSLNKTATSLYVDGQETLTAIVEPDNATDKTVAWSSSNESVATVNTSGVVTAVANGTATITATSNDDDTKSASCDVTVTTYVAPTYQESGTTDMSVGYVYTVQYNSDKSLTITITLTGNLTNMAAPVFYDTSNHYTMQPWSNLSSTYTTTVHYEEEQSTSNWYIKIPYEGGKTAEISMSNYTVGADNTSCGTCFKVTF